MRLFGRKKSEDKGIVFADPSEEMLLATAQAQQNFKYFWREVYWEYRRIVPAHDLALVKVAFEQILPNETSPTVEHMWISQINFDGEHIHGILMNAPNELTNVSEGDEISILVADLSDWMFSTNNKVYGGYTIQALRSSMSNKQRKEHDDAWGLDFGDYRDIKLVFDQEEHPENLIEHPMSISMKEKAREFIKENPESVPSKDDKGLTMLHNEAIAGNKGIIEVLLGMGADKNNKSINGKKAIDYAKLMGWTHIVSILE